MPIKPVRLTVILSGACISGFGSLPGYSQPNYLTDLGAVAPAVAINASGQVALERYLYSSGTLTPLPSGMCGAAIDNNGDVAGTIISQGGTCGPVPFIAQGNAAVFSGGTLTEYPVAGSVTGINDSGTIVGENFLITNGSQTASGTYTAINDAGQIVALGTSSLPINQYPFSVSTPTVNLLGQGGSLIPVNNGTNNGTGYAINSNGTGVAGYWNTVTSLTPPPIQTEVMTQYGAVFPANGAVVQFLALPDVIAFYGINSVGFAVGDYGEHAATPMHAAISNNNGEYAYDLNDFVLPTDPLKPYVTLVDARGINDGGLVVVNGIDSRTKEQHAYLLQVPLVEVSPAILVYSNLPAGMTSAPQTATFTNLGAANVALGGVTVPAGGFSVQSTTCGASLAPNASCSASVVFTSAGVGTPSGFVSLTAAGVPIGLEIAGSLSISVKAGAATAYAFAPLTLSWTATPGANCSASQTIDHAPPPLGVPSDGWPAGSVASSGTTSVTPQLSGTYVFYVSCTAGVEDQAQSQQNFAEVLVTWPHVTATLSASADSVGSGSPITLTWTSQNATGCTGSGGGTGDGWAAAKLPANGSRAITEPGAIVTGQSETLTFTISCSSSSYEPAGTASVKVVQRGPSSGGGGAFDLVTEALLSGILLRRLRTRLRAYQPACRLFLT